MVDVAPYAALAALVLAPAAGGALMLHLVSTRARRRVYGGVAVGQIPFALRRRRAMAVRRGEMA